MDNQEYIKDFIARAIREDVGDGDHTSLSCIPADQRGKAQLLVKQDGIHNRRHTREERRRGICRGRTRTLNSADRTPGAQLYAAHERNCHADKPLR